MQRYFIELSFKGTAYHGWQIQPNALAIQQVLNEKISRKLGEEIYCVGCGRTDTGVHARKFYAHFDVNSVLPSDFVFRMNTFLPRDIFIHAAYPVPMDAHARFSAVERTYVYILSVTKDPFMLDYCGFVFSKLNIEEMNKAAALLLNFADFEALSKVSKDQDHYLCTITSAQWKAIGNKLEFTITANRFLRGMVRIIVGTLIEVGKGKLTVEEFGQIIAAGNRQPAAGAAPADGLYLTDVKYPVGLILS